MRQRLIRSLGRKNQLAASSELDRLEQSLNRHCERSLILSEIDAGALTATRIGGPLLFGRLWERLGVSEVMAEPFEGSWLRVRS